MSEDAFNLIVYLLTEYRARKENKVVTQKERKKPL